MISFLKSKRPPKPKTSERSSFTSRLKQGLTRTRKQLNEGLASLVLGKKTIDDELLNELETTLLLADVGIPASEKILAALTQQVSRKELTSAQALVDALQSHLQALLEPCSKPLVIDTTPFVILIVGVNGAGKTTSIAKIAHFYQQQGKKVMLAAGDTFRAAAVEQLQVWGERNKMPVIAQQTGADSASVIFDAVQAAKARQYDILIADTAGRLHTQDHLMDELAKIKRVMQKLDANAPHETMLVIDASMGQNALNQAQQFHDVINLTGMALTKLDGTAKGGIVFAIADKMQLPIRFIGVGEQIDDLKPFDSKTFVEALFQSEVKK